MALILRSTRYLCILVLLTAYLSPSQAVSDNLSQDVGNWDVFEINLTTTNAYSNPYLDVWLNATFNGPNNLKINIDGFWDGGNTWKIRMAPTEVGSWNYSTSSNDPYLNGKTGNFVVTESGKKGFVKVNPINPYHFIYDDGTPFFYLGDTAWRSTDPVFFPFNGSYQNWVDTRADQGFTLLQTNLQLTVGASEGGPAFPYYPDTTIINPGYYTWVDKRIEYATQKGLVVQFSFTWSHNYMNINLTNYRNYIKYIMSRYSAYNVFFSIMGEYEEIGNVSEVRFLGEYAAQKNPYDHPITTHTIDTTTDDFGNDTWISYHGQQQRILTPQQTNSNIIRDRAYGKPVVLVETCYEQENAELTCPPNNDEYRKAGWSASVGGGYYIYGNYNLIDDEMKNWSTLRSQGSKEMEYLLSFWKNIEYWKMSPNNTLSTNGFTLYNNSEYIIYLPIGGCTTVNLSSTSGTLLAEWYNPRNGIYQNRTAFRGGASRTFEAPDSNDWVLHIYSTPTVLFQFLYFDLLLNPLKLEIRRCHD